MSKRPRLPVFLFCLGIISISGATVGAGDLAVATLDSLKSATVFIKVERNHAIGNGTGFVTRVNGSSVYVATNYHVVANKPNPKNSLGRLRDAIAETPSVEGKTSVVFHSGRTHEVTYTASILGVDPPRDLAVLLCEGVKSPPTAVPVLPESKLVETMPVFVFGFPFGASMTTNQRRSSEGNPAISIGRAAVSSLRHDAAGNLAVVQIDGELHPGNSGGPVVDDQGRLVGVSFAIIKGTRIGLALPANHVVNLLKSLKIPEPAIKPGEVLIPVAPPPAKALIKPLTDTELAATLVNLRSSKTLDRWGAAMKLSKAEPRGPRDDFARALERLLYESDRFSRQIGARALGSWGTKDSVPVLLKVLDDDSYKVRWAVIEALGKLRDERAAAPIAAKLATDREQAGDALITMGAVAEPAVVDILGRSKDPETRLEACKILKKIGTPQSAGKLGALVKDRDDGLARAAKEALQAINSRSAKE